MNAARSNRIAIISPVFNDWESFWHLLRELDSIAPSWNAEVDVIAVNDGSYQPYTVAGPLPVLNNLSSVEILCLICNQGHQRAIAVGLVHVFKSKDYDLCIVMDSDGEDRPQDVAQMLETARNRPESIVAARRAQRSENWRFRTFYKIYKVIFSMLTGKSIDFGNFCLVPRSQIGRLVYMTELWNHFAATIVRSKVPIERIDTARGHRYAGQSTMNFVALVMHGLSAVSVFSDVLFVRLLVFSFCSIALPLLLTAIVVGVRLFTDLAVPGWATFVIGFAIVWILQLLALSSNSVFTSLSSRSNFPYVPALNALALIGETVCLHQTSTTKIRKTA